MPQQETRVLTTTIHVPLAVAYGFAHQPLNFPKWAAGLSSSLRETEQGWVAAAPQGQAHVRFSEPNRFGVLDHWVDLPGLPTIYIPLRMVANGEHTEVELMLFRQPSMSDEDFEKDQAMVRDDLAALKALLEKA